MKMIGLKFYQSDILSYGLFQWDYEKILGYDLDNNFPNSKAMIEHLIEKNIVKVENGEILIKQVFLPFELYDKNGEFFGINYLMLEKFIAIAENLTMYKRLFDYIDLGVE